MQHGVADNYAPVVFFTHKTDEMSMRKALHEIETLDVVHSVDAVIRVL